MTRSYGHAAGYAAAGLSLIWALVHLVIGSPETAAPIRAADLPEVTRATAWLVWHFLSGLLLVMAATFAVATRLGSGGGLAAATAQAVVLAVLGLALAPWIGVGYAILPQGWLFVPVAALGAAAFRGLG